uniref:Uncharacterized protein n=1 Tax=Oryza meridionalis TaxID=40149 RepID=A0A0E0ECJ1_9ORYZ
MLGSSGDGRDEVGEGRTGPPFATAFTAQPFAALASTTHARPAIPRRCPSSPLHLERRRATHLRQCCTASRTRPPTPPGLPDEPGAVATTRLMEKAS